MIRVLQCVNDMHRAGLETMLMNYYRHIDRSLIQFDFLTHRPYRSDYDDEIEALGGQVYYAPRLYPRNYPDYFKWMDKFFSEHSEYTIMHSHIDSMSFLPLSAGKKAKIPYRIAHSHNTSIDKDYKYLLKQLFRGGINSVSTNRLACGTEAGKFLFGNKSFDIIPNAVDSEHFIYSFETRRKKRKELGINNELVVGHVGRLSYQKNHKFLIKIFDELVRLKSDALLLLIGVGEKEAEIRAQVKSLGLENKVLFLGNRSDVSELYQAMDVFVLPSLFEGVPVVGIEAQFADLPCIFSDNVPDEVKFNPKTSFMSLNLSPSDWADAIISIQASDVRNPLNNTDSRYEITNSVHLLQDYYLKLDKEEKHG